MYERILTIESVDPIVLFGVNEKNIEFLRTRFAGVKIVARGNEIKIAGKEEEVDALSALFVQMIELIDNIGYCGEREINNLLTGSGIEEYRAIKDTDVLVHGRNGATIKARSINQRKMVEAYQNHDLIFAIGPAGTGKTYTAVALAVRALKNKEVKRIILTRPAVEAGEKLGFLPGDFKEKLDPYLQPLYDALNDMLPANKLNNYIEDGTIQIAPLAYMRGRTLDNAVAILDEAQNATLSQLKMFLTRMGRNSKFFVTGDITQIDLPKNYTSGLLKAKELLSNIEGISFIDLDHRDVLRHPLVNKILERFEKNQNRNNHKE